MNSLRNDFKNFDNTHMRIKIYREFYHSIIYKANDRCHVEILYYGNLTYCVVFFFIVCLRLVSCVPNVVSFSGLSIFDCPFDVLYTGFLFHQISIYIINPLHKLTIIICNTDTAFKLIIRTWMAQ